MNNGRFLPYLCEAAKAAREGHTPKPSQQNVAERAGIAISTLQRFEAVPPSWLDDTDDVIKSYAYFTKREPIDIWRDALQRWIDAPAEPIEDRRTTERRADGTAPTEATHPAPRGPQTTPPSRRRAVGTDETMGS